jgi:hypothetical protein
VPPICFVSRCVPLRIDARIGMEATATQITHIPINHVRRNVEELGILDHLIKLVGPGLAVVRVVVDREPFQVEREDRRRLCDPESLGRDGFGFAADHERQHESLHTTPYFTASPGGLEWDIATIHTPLTSRSCTCSHPRADPPW